MDGALPEKALPGFEGNVLCYFHLTCPPLSVPHATGESTMRLVGTAVVIAAFGASPVAALSADCSLDDTFGLVLDFSFL